MVAMKNLAALALAYLPGVVSSAACLNSPNFQYPSTTDVGSPMKNCKQIRNNERRRLSMCQIKEVNDACPQSCGVCCGNDIDWEFKLSNTDKMANCYWLVKNKKKKAIRKARYCTKSEDQVLFNYEGRTVRDACPYNCDFCKTKIEIAPTPSPIAVTSAPTLTGAPTASPSSAPSVKPSAQPTRPPSPQPSPFPTLKPTTVPSDEPSQEPSKDPSTEPSRLPSDEPSMMPSKLPSDEPSQEPSKLPSDEPSQKPSDEPSVFPSKLPSDQPSVEPSMDPSQQPSFQPSDQPSQFPSLDPSDEPSHNPTSSIKPSASPSKAPASPTPAPTPVPTPSPTVACNDSSTYKFNLKFDTSKERQCDWLTTHVNNDIDTTRLNTYCELAAVKDECCASCVGYPIAGLWDARN